MQFFFLKQDTTRARKQALVILHIILMHRKKKTVERNRFQFCPSISNMVFLYLPVHTVRKSAVFHCYYAGYSETLHRFNWKKKKKRSVAEQAISLAKGKEDTCSWLSRHLHEYVKDTVVRKSKNNKRCYSNTML